MFGAEGKLVALTVAVGFCSGLNIYATVAALGLMGRYHLVELPAGLHALESWGVLAVSFALFLIEFVADKIPGVDLVWNALHTVIRIPLAALLAFAAGDGLSPSSRALVAVLGAALAAVAHSSKTLGRVAVNASPEPVSNAVVSGGEDLAAIGLSWVAAHHPVLGGSIALALAAGLLVAAWAIARRVRAAWQRLVERVWGGLRAPVTIDAIDTHPRRLS